MESLRPISEIDDPTTIVITAYVIGKAHSAAVIEVPLVITGR